MRRSIGSWTGLSAAAVASGSPAPCEFCIGDAKHDIIELWAANMKWAGSDVLALTAQRDALLEALRRIRNVTANAAHEPKAVKAWDYAVEAIAKATETDNG